MIIYLIAFPIAKRKKPWKKNCAQEYLAFEMEMKKPIILGKREESLFNMIQEGNSNFAVLFDNIYVKYCVVSKVTQSYTSDCYFFDSKDTEIS